jgi:arylsulfatase A-like enzyme
MRPQLGFTHWFAHPQEGASYYTDSPMVRDGKLVPFQGYFSDIITDDALAFIGANADHPFYLSLHFTAPHSPWDCHPRDLVESYADCPFESCPQEPRHPWARPFTDEHLGNRESLKGYFAAVTAMDANVGRILQCLEERGLRDNTLIIFTSDNGNSCGHHGFWGKGNGTFPLNMYENSVKVPFLASHPGRIPSGQVNDALLSAYDLFPTLLEYVGLPVPGTDNRPGRSFAPLLQGRPGEDRDSVVVHSEYGPVRMIRTREWKYVHRYPYGPAELFDLAQDPGERTNVCDDPANLSVQKDLERRLNEWFVTYAEPVRDGSRLPVTGMGQLTAVDLEHPPGDAFARLDDFL